MSQVMIVFVDDVGVEHSVAANIGGTLMEAGRDAGVPNILADCGGACACATCHVVVTPEWLDAVGGEAAGAEAEMLEFVETRQTGSRLACQIAVTEACAGLRVTAPAP